MVAALQWVSKKKIPTTHRPTLAWITKTGSKVPTFLNVSSRMFSRGKKMQYLLGVLALVLLQTKQNSSSVFRALLLGF
jgi:hypothetical protein